MQTNKGAVSQFDNFGSLRIRHIQRLYAAVHVESISGSLGPKHHGPVPMPFLWQRGPQRPHQTDPTNPAGSDRKHLGHFSTPARSELGSTHETVRTRTRAGRCRQSGGGMITLYRRTGVSLLANWLRALLCHSTSELPESNSSLQSSLTSQFRLIVEVHHGLCYTPPQPALNS